MNEQTNHGPRLICSCCGGNAGCWRQHPNQDTGYGVCLRCITRKRMRGESEQEITRLYGIEGVNWGMRHEIYGRSVRVLAAFGASEQGQANAWMKAHSTHSLLAIHEGLALIADENDKGQRTRGPLRRLTCCCCGGDAGRWHQHWNRDHGYGACVRCITWARMSGESEEEILSNYGIEGVNWGMHVIVWSHSFRVAAAFRADERELVDKWLKEHPTQWLFDVQEDLSLITERPQYEMPEPGSPGGIESGQQRMSRAEVESTILVALRVAPELFEHRGRDAQALPLARHEWNKLAEEARQALAQLEGGALRIVHGSGAVMETERKALFVRALRLAHAAWLQQARGEGQPPHRRQQYENLAAKASVVYSRLEVGTLNVFQTTKE